MGYLINMLRVLVGIVCMLLALPAGAMAQDVTLSLDEAIAFALRDNRDILLKSADVEKAKLKIKEAYTAFSPTVTFSGGWNKTFDFYKKDISQISTQTSVKQYLFKGFKAVNNVKYAGYNFEVSQAILNKTQLDTALNVVNSFYALLLAEELAAINRSIVDNTDKHLEVAKKRFASGQASASEVVSIEAALKEVEKAYEVSLNQAESLRTLLNNLLYLDKDAKIKPIGGFLYEEETVAFDEAFVKAMRLRPEIKQYESQIKAAKRQAEMTRADSRPTVYASWDYYTKSHVASLSGLSRNWNDYNLLGVTFSWPVFDGFATRMKVQQALVDVKSAQFNKEKAISDIAMELKSAVLDLDSAISKIRSAQAQSNAQKNTLVEMQQKYTQGIRSALDVEDALLSYDIALFNQKEAAYDYVLAKARFDKATGGLIQ
ncbi:MAG: TolC family protein [Candidatus Omnitrophica bacterium]|nr:TolC family protein [Candidatus Omnitrophota bacterium]